MARKAVEYMAKHPKTPVVIVSLTEDQACIIMAMAQNYAKEYCPQLIGRGVNKSTLKSMHVNGGKMIVRPVGNTGDGARGFEGGILIVDEAARMPKLFWIAAKPILLTTNGKLWLASTPFGQKGYFWEKYNETVNLKDPNSRFKVWSISTEQVVKEREICASWTQEQRDGALRILAEDIREMTAQEYMQEYMGQFVNALLSYFPDELIDKCCILKRQPRNQEDKYYMGCDIGGLGKDCSSYEIIAKDRNDCLKHVENITTKRQYVTDTLKRVLELNTVWNPSQIGIDNAGLGVSIFHPLLNLSATKFKTVGLDNSTKYLDYEGKRHTKLLKEDMYQATKAAMENGTLLLLDDDTVRNSLRSIQQELVVSDAKESMIRITGRDSHITEGIIRSVWLAVNDKTLKLWVEAL